MDMTHTRVSAVHVKERKDECQMLRMSYSRGKKRREKEMLGWAFPAPCAQVSIRLVFDFSLKMQPPQPGHTPGCSASTQPPQFSLLTAGASIFCQKSSGQTWQLSAPPCLFVEQEGAGGGVGKGWRAAPLWGDTFLHPENSGQGRQNSWVMQRSCTGGVVCGAFYPLQLEKHLTSFLPSPWAYGCFPLGSSGMGR